MTPVAADEIYDRYLKKAIAEINRLWTEMAHAGGEGRLPVVGSGHPLADVFMVKHRPQPAEVQEGVAFYGRAGQAILKSLQRLHVDPMAVYGTNCLKFGDEPEAEARQWLERELHIVQPKLVVAMGPDTVAFLNALEFPLSRPLEDRPGDLQHFTPTTEALVVPDIDASLDEQPAKTRFWNSFKQLGPWWAELPPY
ncbi:MAG TPA: uracil-DNA glycosylase family protein [Gaiellaceae bacterium]|nr:uracil-DNA glycosylase family protein [Gaiellaceae bacterium]